MAYGSHAFYPFHLGVFHVKIVVSLWLLYLFLPFSFGGFPRQNCCLIVVGILLFGWLCCWLIFFVEPILAHEEGNVIFRFIVFDSLSQQYLFALAGLDVLMVLFLGFYTKKTSYKHYSP